MNTELLVGSYISRTTSAKVRVVRVAPTHIYRAYIDGVLSVEGSRREAMAATR